MRKILLFVLASAALLVATGAEAADKSYRDVLGLWCGSISTYSITREKLTVTLLADNSRRTYTIEGFEFAPDMVTMNWKTASGEAVWTKFSDFSEDGLNMVQLSNDAGPRREFRRC